MKTLREYIDLIKESEQPIEDEPTLDTTDPAVEPA